MHILGQMSRNINDIGDQTGRQVKLITFYLYYEQDCETNESDRGTIEQKSTTCKTK